MIKKIDLSGIWNFELDPDKKGIEARLFDKAKNDTSGNHFYCQKRNFQR